MELVVSRLVLTYSGIQLVDCLLYLSCKVRQLTLGTSNLTVHLLLSSHSLLVTASTHRLEVDSLDDGLD